MEFHGGALPQHPLDGRQGCAVYMALGADVARPSANVDFQWAYTFMGLHQLNKNVDFVVGGRWNVLQGNLDFKGPLISGRSLLSAIEAAMTRDKEP